MAEQMDQVGDAANELAVAPVDTALGDDEARDRLADLEETASIFTAAKLRFQDWVENTMLAGTKQEALLRICITAFLLLLAMTQLGERELAAMSFTFPVVMLMISRDEARTHPRRNIVTRALGIEPAADLPPAGNTLPGGEGQVLGGQEG